MPVALPSAQEINDELKRLQHRGFFADPNSVEYRAIERKIRPLMNTDSRGEAYALLGALRGLAGDLEELHSNFKNALRLTQDPTVRVNYSIALNNLGYFSEAAKDFAFWARPENGSIEKAVLLNTECGRFRSAATLVKAWNSLHQEGQWCVNNLEEVARIVEAAGIGENAFLPCLDIAGEVLRQARLIFYDEPLIQVLGNEGAKRISYHFLVLVDAEKAADLESKMVDKLFDSGVELHESFISFGFLAVEQSKKQAA